jgi:hypothetical protein
MNTFFTPNRQSGGVLTIQGGCFRLDLGKEMQVDSVVVRVKDLYSLQPLVFQQGSFAYISSDLSNWEKITYVIDLNMKISINSSFRYLKLNPYPDAIAGIDVYSGGKKVNNDTFRASNLFADSSKKSCIALWNNSFVLDEIAKNSYLSVAINGKHGSDGAYAALKVDGKLVGSPSRSTSYPSNTFETRVYGSDSNYTYYFPLDESMKNKNIEVFVMGYNSQNVNLNPEVWISAYPFPYKEKRMIIQ